MTEIRISSGQLDVTPQPIVKQINGTSLSHSVDECLDQISKQDAYGLREVRITTKSRNALHAFSKTYDPGRAVMGEGGGLWRSAA